MYRYLSVMPIVIAEKRRFRRKPSWHFDRNPVMKAAFTEKSPCQPDRLQGRLEGHSFAYI
jgi:hypothetical protein